MATDRFGRNIHYLRVSLTDRCNLRCVYCMPEDVSYQPSQELMQDEEILLLVRLFAEAGFDKIRLTGGEPTARAGVVDLVRAIAQTPGVRSLSMTTNGVLLPRLAQSLARAGLQRVNISVDSLDSERFREMTRRGSLDDVWQGIRAVEAAGLGPVKLNAVIVRGLNEADVPALARLTLDHPWQVRFIEMMPVGVTAGIHIEEIVTHQEVRGLIEEALGSLEVANDGHLDGEARLFRLPGARGEIGLISSVTQPFCASCTRVRLTADGQLRLCLLRDKEVDLLTPLRCGVGEAELRRLILDGIWNKPWGHGLAEDEIPLDRTMNAIGG